MIKCKLPHNAPLYSYRKGCRCDRCRLAKSEYMTKRNATPEAKAKRSKRNATPEGKAYNAETTANHRVKYPLKARYNSMMARCFKLNDKDFKHYGGRGITVSEELQDFLTYEKYIMSLPGFDLSLQIDRIDNSGNYERGNLRWATSKEQAQNRRKKQ